MKGIFNFSRWRAEKTGRTVVLPHIKSYCRVSPDSKRLSWFLLTSACLTNAWGLDSRDNKRYSIRNYELGVLFFPEYFGEEYFAIKEVDENEKRRIFPLMYDVENQGDYDEPWQQEKKVYDPYYFL